MKIQRDENDTMHLNLQTEVPNSPNVAVVERYGSLAQYNSCMGVRFYSKEGSVFVREDVLEKVYSWVQEKTPKPKPNKHWTEKIRNHAAEWELDEGCYIVDFTLQVFGLRKETADKYPKQLAELFGETEEYSINTPKGKIVCFRLLQTNHDHMSAAGQALRQQGIKSYF